MTSTPPLTLMIFSDYLKKETLTCLSYIALTEHLDKSNNTMANAVNGEVEEDGENRGQAEEEMEEGGHVKNIVTASVNGFLVYVHWPVSV